METKNNNKISEKERWFLKIKIFLEWFLGVIFLIFGFLLLFSNFWSGFFGLLAGIFLMPVSYNFLKNKFLFFSNKWIRGLVIFLGLILFLFISGGKVYTYQIKTGKDNQEMVMNFQKDLRDLIIAYKEAQIRTLVISQIKFGGVELKEAEQYVEETGKNWKKVEDLAKTMEKYVEYREKNKKETSFFSDPIIFVAQAMAKEDSSKEVPGSFSGNSGEVQLQDSSKNLIQTDWDLIEVEKAVIPDATTLQLVQKHFGVSAKKAQELIESYHGGMAEFWKNEEKYYQSKQNFVRGIATTANVALTVGGLGVTYAGLAELAATGTGLSALKLATETAVLAVVKADAIMEVMETGIIVSTGDEDQAASITKAREFFSPILKLISLKDLALNPTFADGGNLVTVTGLANDGTNKLLEFGAEEAKIKIDLPKGSRMTEDGLAKEYFPSEFQYDENGFMWGVNEKGEIKINNQEEKKEEVQKKTFKEFEGCQFRDPRVCDKRNYAVVAGSTNGRTLCRIDNGMMTLDCEVLPYNPYEYSDEYKKWLNENQ